MAVVDRTIGDTRIRVKTWNRNYFFYASAGASVTASPKNLKPGMYDLIRDMFGKKYADRKFGAQKVDVTLEVAYFGRPAGVPAPERALLAQDRKVCRDVLTCSSFRRAGGVAVKIRVSGEAGLGTTPGLWPVVGVGCRAIVNGGAGGTTVEIGHD